MNCVRYLKFKSRLFQYVVITKNNMKNLACGNLCCSSIFCKYTMFLTKKLMIDHKISVTVPLLLKTSQFF